MERVVVLADIHGVLAALEAVLAEPEVASADAIVLAGDIASGPQPGETLDRLVALGKQAVWVRGNADRELVTAYREPSEPAPGDNSHSGITEWGARLLRPDQVSLLDELPTTVTLDVGGPVLFCHATPRDDEEMVLVDSPISRWATVLAGVPDEVRTIVCGHTHMPFARQVDRRLVVNAGSVGMPYGAPGASWALLTPSGAQLRRTYYDTTQAADDLAKTSTFPHIAAWADEYLRTTHSDTEALAAFRPRAEL